MEAATTNPGDFDRVLEGLTCIGADAYTAQFWKRKHREALEVLADDPGKPWYPGSSRFHWRRAYRLPNGDVMVVQDASWARYTSDPEVIGDVRMRKAIIGHRYRLDLLKALHTLELHGALRLACYSWFGGSFHVESGNVVPCYGGTYSSYGREKIQRLRSHLEKCIEQNPSHRADLVEALGLVTDEAIVEVFAD